MHSTITVVTARENHMFERRLLTRVYTVEVLDEPRGSRCELVVLHGSPTFHRGDDRCCDPLIPARSLGAFAVSRKSKKTG